MHTCFSCGSTKTYVDRHGWTSWHKQEFLNSYLYFCQKCYTKYFHNPKWGPIWNPIINKKHGRMRLTFRGKEIKLNRNPKTGYCSMCSNNIHDKSCMRTSLHHFAYHVDDPLKDTIELCNKCHRTIHLPKSIQ